MKATTALRELKNGETVVDDNFHCSYCIPDSETQKHLCDGEDIYVSRKDSGEFISFEDFLDLKYNFKLESYR